MLAARLEIIGNIHSDGRPILGLDCKDLFRDYAGYHTGRDLCTGTHLDPSFCYVWCVSGFDSVEECFEDLTDAFMP